MAALQKEAEESPRTERRAVEPDTVTLHPRETGRYDHGEDGMYVCVCERENKEKTQSRRTESERKLFFIIRAFTFCLLIIELRTLFTAFLEVNNQMTLLKCGCSEERVGLILHSGSHALSLSPSFYLFSLLRLHF